LIVATAAVPEAANSCNRCASSPAAMTFRLTMKQVRWLDGLAAMSRNQMAAQ
jgi:hypothetical protein